MGHKLRIKCLLFEGCDKVGKSSVIEAFHKLTNYEWYIIDRSLASIYVYGGFKDRNLDYSSLFSLDDEYSRLGRIIVYVTADTEVIKKRFKKHNEKDILETDIDLIKSGFEIYLQQTSMKVIRLDTSNCTSKESAKELLEKLNEIGINGLTY
jgi:thymidylate kinase